MTLEKLKPGECAYIIHIGGHEKLRRRLLDMGLTPGTLIVMKKRAPLKDPLEISVRSYELVLRKQDASLIEIEVIH